jgi:hypothetical protein
MALLTTLALVGIAGCGGTDEAPEHKSIKGKVTRIDTSSGQVCLMWYNPKEKAEKEITGTLSSNAEICINGKTARLEDVMVDDEVTVTGFREKHDGVPRLVAVKVDIRRATASEPAEPAGATPPASQPQQ